MRTSAQVPTMSGSVSHTSSFWALDVCFSDHLWLGDIDPELMKFQVRWLAGSLTYLDDDGSSSAAHFWR
jgi:hypothetical protein